MLLVGNAACWATGPLYQTDYQISQHPIVVVATWDRAAVREHHLIAGNVCKEPEAFTELNVLRVLRGDLQPGKHQLMFGWGVAWNADGSGLATWTSTDIPGDVDDITRPSLWFLDRKRSWDAADPLEYLHIPYYRAVQPLALEPYFQALLTPDRDRAVIALLQAGDPLIVRRALRYACGEIWPWPFGPREGDELAYDRPRERERLLAEAAPAVGRVIDSTLEELRPLAVAVYAELVKTERQPRLRALLADRNPTVRSVAIGLLTRDKDAASLTAMATAVAGVDDASVACRIIDAVTAWDEPRAVPLLIPFLENDRSAYRYGDDWGIPALKARAALHALTGCWFPYRVSAAADAWSQVADLADRPQQKRRLAELLPDPEFPVTAELVGTARPASSQPAPTTEPTRVQSALRAGMYLPADDALVTVRLRNVIGHPITIRRFPSAVNLQWPGGLHDYAAGPQPSEETNADFTDLTPGEVIEFEIALYSSFLRAEPDRRMLRLEYARFPPTCEEHCWIGMLSVEFGALWKEERKFAWVEECWPNGNLRARGQTLNGDRFGEWHFFNEAGDRIRIVDYSGGHAETVCNPAHSDNKRAGRRPATATQTTGP